MTSPRSSPCTATGVPWTCRSRAIVTDDTQMTLALGRGLRTAMDRGRSARSAWSARCARSSWSGGAPGEQPCPRQHLPARLSPAVPRRPALAGRQPNPLQGLRRQHARRPRRPGPRPHRRTARRGRPAAVRPHPRPPHRARRLRPHRARRTAARRGRRTDRPDRAAPLLRLREPHPLPRVLARRPVDPRPGPLPGALHRARLGRVPGDPGPPPGSRADRLPGDRPVQGHR